MLCQFKKDTLQIPLFSKDKYKTKLKQKIIPKSLNISFENFF